MRRKPPNVARGGRKESALPIPNSNGYKAMKKFLLLVAMSALALFAVGGEGAAALVKSFEGFQPSVYKCAAGKPTIGYGCTSPAIVARGTITEREAAALVSAKCDEIAARVRKEFTLKPHEEAAVVSFVYNVGWGAFKSSTMFRLLKEGKRGAAVAVEFRKWTKVTANGRKVESRGLARRRGREALVFLGV